MWSVELEPEVEVFRKQRQNERREVQRARQAMARCIDEAHTAEEEN